MLQELQYNNKILSQEERVKFNDLADEMIATFSESIDGMYKISKEYTDMNNIQNKVSKIMGDVSVFVSYAFADCVVLTKLFVQNFGSCCTFCQMWYVNTMKVMSSYFRNYRSICQDTKRQSVISYAPISINI